MSNDTEWESFLNEGETVNWQGRPDATRGRQKIRAMYVLGGGAFILFGLVWILVTAGDGGWKWVVGLAFLTLGIYQIAEYPYVRPYVRSRTWYALTNQRALIVHDVPLLGRKLRSFPITSQMPLGFIGKERTGIYFAERRPLYSNGQGKIPYGFEFIPDAEHVHDLMSDMKKATS